jgi:hypothetical protein
VGNSRYYNYNISRNGVVEQHHSDYGLDYFTDLISRDANAWIANITAAGSADHSQPFLAVLSTPACHDGTIPAPQYDNVRSPRATATYSSLLSSERVHYQYTQNSE